MTTLSDIARAVGVTPAVVSRVVNRDETLRISDETRARVLRAIKEMDYAPNMAARSLRSTKSGMIAMALHDVSNPVYAEILKGAEAAATRAGKALILFDLSTSTESAAHLARMIGGGGVDGLIVQSAGGETDPILARAAARKVPVILLQATVDAPGTLLSLPDRMAAEMATRHLTDLGHRAIGCLATARDMTFTGERVKGWQAALEARALPAPPARVVYAASDIDSGAAAAGNLLDQAPEITAIVAFNVMAAIGALQVLGEHRIRVPRDMSLIAIHDLRLADFLSTPLTTVVMPLYDMGRQAVELLETDNPPEHASISGGALRIHLRASTAAPRA